MDALAAVCEHPMFGLMVWVGIAVLNEMQVQWAIRTVAGLVVVKTYLSSTWAKKRDGNYEEDTGNRGAGGTPDGLHQREDETSRGPV
jgi:membrane protein implicated in regulation of membrane protease activity